MDRFFTTYVIKVGPIVSKKIGKRHFKASHALFLGYLMAMLGFGLSTLLYFG